MERDKSLPRWGLQEPGLLAGGRGAGLLEDVGEAAMGTPVSCSQNPPTRQTPTSPSSISPQLPPSPNRELPSAVCFLYDSLLPQLPLPFLCE